MNYTYYWSHMVILIAISLAQDTIQSWFSSIWDISGAQNTYCDTKNTNF